MAEKKWLLDFQGVQIARHEHILFEQLDLQVAAGEFVYLTGPVGSGKSTLLKTISAEVPLTKGKANVMGFDLSRIKSKELPKLRRRLGIVFQNFQLLPDQTVHDNLDIVLRAFGVSRSSERESLINEALQDVGLETKSYKYPHELSGGEQQRVAIARAIINNPDLLICDEPTGNLDPDTANGIMDLLAEINETGTTIVMVTHAKDIVDRMRKRVVAIDSGHIVRDEYGDYGYSDSEEVQDAEDRL